MLLVETSESVDLIDDLLLLDGIDFIYINLNDLSLGYGTNICLNFLRIALLRIIIICFEKRYFVRFWVNCTIGSWGSTGLNGN